MRAVGYYRPPPQVQTRDPNSLADSRNNATSPLAEIEQFCRFERHQLISLIPANEGVIPPDVDASSDESLFDELLSAFREPDARPALLVIPDATHLATDLPQLVRRLLLIEEIGGTIRCADLDMPDPLQSGLLYLAMPGGNPAVNRRVRDAVLAKAARGQVVGRVPYGYSAGIDGSFQPVTHEAAVVKDIFNWYLGEPQSEEDELGDGNDGIGFRRIASRLDAAGVATRSGKLWSPVAISGILRNRAYIGTYAAHGMRLVGNHKPLVDRAVFNRTQEVLASRRPVRRQRTPGSYLLHRILRCETCGQGLRGISRTRKWQRKQRDARERIYRYYECPSHRGRASGGDSGQQKHASWRAELIESEVIKRLKKDLARRRTRKVPMIDAHEITRRDQAIHKDFMTHLRIVATGRGRLQDLDPILLAVEAAHSEDATAATEETATVRRMLELAESDDVDDAARAVRALVESVTVSSTEVAEIALKF